MSFEDTSADRNVEIWKIKKLIKSLELARGNGTSMISLIIPPKDQISRVSKMLADEFGTASNIKSRVNRLSVLGAITSVQHRLKLYTKGEFSTEVSCNMFHGIAFQCLQTVW
jgi:peptide chain release factor subunit 1